MHGRSGARAVILGAAVAVAGCSGDVQRASSGASGSGGGAATSTSTGASTSGMTASGTTASGTGGSGTGTSGTGGASTGYACGDAKDQGALAQQPSGIFGQEAICYNSGDTVTCLESSVGLTEACAVCYADGFLCFVETCGPSCSGTGFSGACKACFTMACLPAQAACTGPVPGG